MQIATIRRYSGYMFWAAAEQALTIGATRLFLFPIGAYLIGKEPFGLFVTALSAAAMLGTTPSIGLATAMVRHMAEYPDERRGRFCFTAICMCHRAMCVLIAIGLAGVAAAAVLHLRSGALLACLAPLLLSLYGENQLSLTLTELRVRRHFRESTAWCGLQAACASALGITGTLVGIAITSTWGHPRVAGIEGSAGRLLGGAVGLACGYAAGNLVAYAVLRRHRREWFRESYDRDMARVLKAVWFHITLASILLFSGQYLNRLILSRYSFADVSDLYGATTVLYLLLAPVSSGSVLLLNMLARYTSTASLSRAAKANCVLVTIAAVVGLPIVLKVAGPLLLKIVFPGLGPSAARLLDILVWAMPFGVLMFLVRPFVIKFAPVQVNPIINTTAMAGQLIPALALIPSFRGPGAAWAVVIGNAVYAIALVLVLAAVLLRRRPSSGAVAGEESTGGLG